MAKITVGRVGPEKKWGLTLLPCDEAAVRKADQVQPPAIAGWIRDESGFHLVVADQLAEKFRRQLTRKRDVVAPPAPPAPRPPDPVAKAEAALAALERIAKYEARVSGQSYHVAYDAVLRTPVGRGLWLESRR